MDDCPEHDMAALVSASRPRPATPMGQVLPANLEAWTLERLRGRPLPSTPSMVYILALARRKTFYIDVADDIGAAFVFKVGIDFAQQRQFGRKGVTPLYCVYVECHPSKESAQQRCAELKAMPHAWQRSIIDRFNPRWLNVANELVHFPCSWDAIGEDGVEALPECAQAPAPTPGPWWVSAQTRANARWSHPVRPRELVSPASVRAYPRAIGVSISLLMERLRRLIQIKIRTG